MIFIHTVINEHQFITAVVDGVRTQNEYRASFDILSSICYRKVAVNTTLRQRL